MIDNATVVEIDGKEVEIPERNDSFYNYINEDKSKYRKASKTENSATGYPYVDKHDDFLIGSSGGFLFNISFKFKRTYRLSPAANIFDPYKNQYIPYKRNSFKYEEWRKREERRKEKRGRVSRAEAQRRGEEERRKS